MEGKLHSPFLCHLFACCGGNYTEFANAINDQIERSIEDIYEEVYDDMKHRTIENYGRSIISKTFKKFVAGKEKCHKNSRNPKYCMLSFYKNIAKLNQELSSNERNLILQSDIDLLQRFMIEFKYFRDRDAVAVNEKRLKEFFKSLKERGELSDDFEYLFDYLLRVFFPEYKNEHGETLLERIKYMPLEEMIFGNHEQHEFIKSVLKNDDRYEKIICLFTNLKDMASYNTENLKESLVEISNLLDAVYYATYNEQIQDISRSNLIEQDSVEEEIFSELHSHILAFMRWVPMMSQDKPNKEMMESVDNVIDQIKEKACEIIDSKEDLKRSLDTYPVNYHDIVFMQDEGIELRKLLIKAMCCEKNICLQFKYFYTEGIPSEEKGGVNL